MHCSRSTRGVNAEERIRAKTLRAAATKPAARAREAKPRPTNIREKEGDETRGRRAVITMLPLLEKGTAPAADSISTPENGREAIAASKPTVPRRRVKQVAISPMDNRGTELIRSGTANGI